MSKMMLIDENYIDEQISYLKAAKSASSVAKWRYDDKLEVLFEIKKQLQSPGEMIKDAYEAGWKENAYNESFHSHGVKKLEEYLKEKKYE